jgi:hypothetical protein
MGSDSTGSKVTVKLTDGTEVNVNENKLKKYIHLVVEEKTGKRKPILAESKKTPLLKEIDKMVNEELTKKKLNEREEKLRKYIRIRLEEKTGKRKTTLNESKKSVAIKKLDKMIDEQFQLYKKLNEGWLTNKIGNVLDPKAAAQKSGAFDVNQANTAMQTINNPAFDIKNPENAALLKQTFLNFMETSENRLNPGVQQKFKNTIKNTDTPNYDPNKLAQLLNLIKPILIKAAADQWGGRVGADWSYIPKTSVQGKKQSSTAPVLKPTE